MSAADDAADGPGESPKAAVPEMDVYEPHPVCEMFPAPNELDIAMMQADVKVRGVQQQIVCWRGPKNKAYLIDGRTRQEGALRQYRKQVAEGKPPTAENGVPLQPDVFWFTGTIDDVYQYAKRSHIRKHYSPGQKSAMGIRLYYYEFMKLHNIRKLPDVEKEIEMAGAKTAEELADSYGANVYYMRICRILYREALDLFDSVALGLIPPPKAKAALEQRINGTAAPEDAGEPAAPGDPTKVNDCHGQAVPAHMEEKFRARSGFRALDRTLSLAIRQAEKIASDPGGDFLDIAVFSKSLGAARKNAARAKPEEVCKDCDGKGHVPGQRYKCKSCRGAGFVCKMIRILDKKEAETATAGAGAAS